MTTLMEEEPYAAVVDSELIPHTCSKCFAWNLHDVERVKLNRCAGCHVLFYCSSKCQKADWKDHKPECSLLRSTGVVPSETVRLIMRMIEKSKKHPEIEAFNGRTYESLMHHSAERRYNDYCMMEARITHTEICLFKGSEAPDFETVFLALSKKAINAVKILDGSWACVNRGTAIYLGLSVLDHSCRPDAFVVNQGSKMILRTTKEDCVYSDKLTISYCDGIFFMDTRLRRAKLQNSYFFLCQCEECKDIESDKKRTSGRSACCPDSWFSLSDHICNSCKRLVHFELAAKAKDAMEHLREAISVSKEAPADSDLSAIVPEWMKLFDACKEVLSDENMALFQIAHIICITLPLTDFALSLKYVELCLPQARKHPHCVFSVTLFCCRLTYYEILKKPLQEIKETLNEALGAAQVVFGPEHEITQTLLQNKMDYDLENHNTP